MASKVLSVARTLAFMTLIIVTASAAKFGLAIHYLR
jgi:hypothetical protein